MDPVTTAITAALSAAASGATTEVAKKAISDSYEGLKGLLKKKYGSESDVAEALDKLDDKPDAKGRRQTVEDELEAVNAGADPELLAAARALLQQINAVPKAEQNVQIAHGTGIAQAAHGSNASVKFDGPPPAKDE
ncbi:hypothetical protein [Paraburkholderia sp. MM5482-R1]|uniref:hypothetical protein n=1 Tax=unclassified Paraburkholderia TaxID=2615204 RepID=UPI003D1ADD5D